LTFSSAAGSVDPSLLATVVISSVIVASYMLSPFIIVEVAGGDSFLSLPFLGEPSLKSSVGNTVSSSLDLL
jgi:hypothetical protein